MKFKFFKDFSDNPPDYITWQGMFTILGVMTVLLFVVQLVKTFPITIFPLALICWWGYNRVFKRS